MMQFLLPLRAVELDINIAVIGVLLGSKALVEASLSVPIGGLIDRFGARRLYLLGTTATVLLGIGYFAAGNLIVLFCLQLLFGVARPLAWVGAQSYVAGLRKGSMRSYDTGRFSFAANLGQIVAPLAVGIVSQVFSVATAFLFLSLYAGGCFLLGLALPDEGRAPSHTSGLTSFSAAAGLLGNAKIRVALLLTFARLFVPATWKSFFPLFLVASGFPEGSAGAVVAAMALTATVFTLLVGRLSVLGSAEMVTASSLALSVIGVGLAPWMVDGVLPFVSAGLVGVGQGVSLPMLIVIVSGAVPDGQRGLALGLRASVNQLASTIAPVVFGSVVGAVGGVIGFPIAGALIGSCLLVATSGHVKHRRDEPHALSSDKRPD